MLRIDELFYVEYPSTLAFSHQRLQADGIHFVTSRGKNNGVVGRVKKIKNTKLYPANSITVPMKGTVLMAHLQVNPFYCAHQIAVLTPIDFMSTQVLLFYVLVIRSNKFRFNYGRQADNTLKSILVPSLDEIPNWVNEADLGQFKGADLPFQKEASKKLGQSKWRLFKFNEVFSIEKGFYNKKPPQSNSKEVPFIGASRENNGVTSYHAFADVEKIFEGNCITVANNGNSVASAFYQESCFTCTHDINVLRLQSYKLTPCIAVFLCVLIFQEKYRWSYGRKWRISRMVDSTIKLPVGNNGVPDWQFMENYIKSLPFSSQILSSHVGEQKKTR